MRAFIAAAFACGLLLTAGAAGPAHAAADFSRSVICQILQPCKIPARYDSGTFLAEPVVREVSLRTLQSRCGGSGHAMSGAAGFGYSYLGCAQIQASRCVVHVPGDIRKVSANLFAMILEHELAHCRGWRHRHY